MVTDEAKQKELLLQDEEEDFLDEGTNLPQKKKIIVMTTYVSFEKSNKNQVKNLIPIHH